MDLPTNQSQDPQPFKRRITLLPILIITLILAILSGVGFVAGETLIKKEKPIEKENQAPVITSFAVSESKWPFVGFSLTYNDPEGDYVKAIFCKTDEIYGEVGKDPSCPGGLLTGPGPKTNSGRFNASYEPKKKGVVHAFVCDVEGACSESKSGSFDVVPRTGYDPNHAPEISEFLITSSSNPQVKLATTTFTVGQVIYFRIIVEDLADSVRVIVCKTAEVEYNSGDLTCPGDAWSGPTPKYFTVPTMIVPRTTSTEEMAGNHSAFAFACDSGAHCSKAAESFFEVENQQPAPSEDTND